MSITLEEVKVVPGRLPLEDRIGSQGNMAWVIDGATARSLVRVAPDHPSDGVWLVDRLDSELRSLADSHAPLQELLAEAISGVARRAASEWIGQPEVPPSAALALTAMRSPGAVEYLVLADCTFATATTDSAFVVSDGRPDADIAERHQKLTTLLKERSFEEAMAVLRPELVERRVRAMNQHVPDGYWVASIDPAAAAEAITGSTEIAPGKPWWLLSDGMARCVDLFGLYSWESFVTRQGFDLETVAHDLLKVEESDPEANAFPRFNISDDKAAARLTWRD